MTWYLWASVFAAIGTAVMGYEPFPFIAAQLVIGAMMELKK